MPQLVVLAGLRARIILLYVITVVLMIGAIVGLSVRSLTEAFNDEYRDKALAIVRTFDAQYDTLADLQDTATTQAQIERLVASYSSIYRISLYAPVGDTILRTASSQKSQIGEPADEIDAEPIITGRTVFYDKIKGEEKLVEVLAPIHADGRPVAAIGIYMHLAPRDDAVRQQAINFAAIGVVAAALLLVALYLSLDWLLLKPLTMLKRLAKDIESGWLHARIRLRRKDELGELAAALNGMAEALENRDLENRELQCRLESQRDQAQVDAITDPVTGLYNHRFFQDRLVNELERARRYNSPVTLLFCDIDHFKIVNDTYGHQFGDQVLAAIGGLMRDTLRDIDVVARYGGEEFAAILPNTKRLGGHEAGERLRQAVANHYFSDHSKRGTTVTVSVGVACFPDDGHTREDLIQKADQGMYYAKQMGRNQVRDYGEVPDKLLSGASPG